MRVRDGPEYLDLDRRQRAFRHLSAQPLHGARRRSAQARRAGRGYGNASLHDDLDAGAGIEIIAVMCLGYLAVAMTLGRISLIK